MKIDVFAHILPKKYFEMLCQRVKPGVTLSEISPWLVRFPALSEIDLRLRLMDKNPDVVHVLTVVLPPLEAVVSTKDAVELARIANDEMANLVAKYPHRFITAVASLPLNDIDAALKEADRAINHLGLRGIQIFSNINGEPLDSPRLKKLYEKMAGYDLPIWIHPWHLPVANPYCKNLPESIRNYFKLPIVDAINWPVDTSIAMMRLTLSGIFQDYPGIKFITHHCGGTVPYLERRMRIQGINMEHMRRFYADTAVYGNTAALMCGYAFLGADHLVLGTDWMGQPYKVTEDTIKAINQMYITEAERKMIYEVNARKLMRL